LEASAAFQEGLREGWRDGTDQQTFEGDILEEIKDKIEAIFEERMADLLKVRKFVNCVIDHGHTVEKSAALDQGIGQLRQFREDFMKRFPSRRPPLPIDREGIARAREAFRNGH